MTAVEPVAHVTRDWQVGQRDDANRRGDAVKMARDIVGMTATYVVVVGQDDDLTATQPVAVPWLPLPRAFRAGRRDDAQTAQPVGILLAFDNADRRSRWRGDDVGQPVRHPLDAGQGRNPPAVPVRSSLRERLPTF